MPFLPSSLPLLLLFILNKIIQAEETCELGRKKEKKHESPSLVTQTTGIFGTTTTTQKVVTKITEYTWDIEVKYSLCAFQGTDFANQVCLACAFGPP
jgi:hypothetical protein